MTWWLPPFRKRRKKYTGLYEEAFVPKGSGANPGKSVEELKDIPAFGLHIGAVFDQTGESDTLYAGFQ